MDASITYVIEHMPTAEREEMRFFKTDSIRRVIISACKLFKVNPEEYELRYAQNRLDPNLYLKFSYLPDGSLLELCHINKQKRNENSSVVVNLVVGDGIVNSGVFRKTASLWDVSQKLLPNDKFVEDERMCISCLSKKVVGPDMLKKMRLSSLKCQEGPLIMSLNRHYSEEKLSVQDKDNSSESDRTDQKSFVIQKSNITQKFNPTQKKTLKKKSIKKIVTVGARFSNKMVLTDLRGIQSKIEKNMVNTFKVEVAIDKSFYLPSGRQLKDIKYLNSRKGIAYIFKKILGESQKEESGVDLLDLRKDYIRTSNDEIQVKIILPDETAVQAIFKHDELMKDVHEFLNSLLRCGSSDYFLYEINPRKMLDNSIPLKKLDVKNGVTLFLSLVPKIKKSWPKSRAFLKNEHLPKIEYKN